MARPRFGKVYLNFMAPFLRQLVSRFHARAADLDELLRGYPGCLRWGQIRLKADGDITAAARHVRIGMAASRVRIRVAQITNGRA